MSASSSSDEGQKAACQSYQFRAGARFVRGRGGRADSSRPGGVLPEQGGVWSPRTPRPNVFHITMAASKVCIQVYEKDTRIVRRLAIR